MCYNSNIFRSLLGGLEICKISTHWPYLIVYLILYAFYSVYLILPQIQNEKLILIGCGALLSSILVFKLVFLFIRFLTRFAISSQDEVRPPQIPPEIWRYKTFLINSQSDIDSAVNDLIISGVDSGKLLELVDYLNDTNQMGRGESIDTAETASDNINTNKMKIQIGSSIYTLPFSLHQIDQISPSTPSLICVLFSVIFGFTSSYLSLTLESQFSVYEKVFLSFVMASSTFSIIHPPAVDPYNTTINDPWNSFSRPFIITIICLAWHLILHFLCHAKQISCDDCLADTITIPQIYDIKIEWHLFLPYIFIALKYGLFLTLAMFFGFYGHPISSIVALLESCARYFLGQNGAGGLLHIFVQLIRGSASVAAVWGIFQIKDPNFSHNMSPQNPTSPSLVRCTSFRIQMICVSIGVSTLINVFPIMLNRFLLKHWASTFFYPILAACLSIGFPYLFVATIDSNYDVLKWFCFSWLVLFELVFPYLYSANQYFFCHFLILPQISFAAVIRYISSLVVSPLFLATTLQLKNRDNPLNDVVLAFLITHAVQKMHSESHVFAFAVFFSVVSLPVDFGLNDPAANLLISLLVASRVESFMPVLKIVQNNRNYQIIADELFELNELPYLIRYIIMKIINNFLILVDVVIKIPTLFWSFFTGGGVGPLFGCPYFLVPQPIRPNYFFDWPRNLNVYQNIYRDKNNESANNRERTPTSLLTILFEKNVNEHPVETPVYMSAVRAVAKSLGPVIRSGRLGYVNAGNIFLFKSASNNAAFFLHVISIEPTCFRFQLRGLEYKSQTICHEGEENNLNDIVNNYDFTSPNIHAAFHSMSCDYDLRLCMVEMLMYDVSTTLLSQAFIGIEAEVCMKWFIYMFAFSLRKYASSSGSYTASHHNSSLNLSANEDLIPVGERISSLVEVIHASFSSLHDILSTDDYSFIHEKRPLFNKAIDFFLTADSEGERSTTNDGLNGIIPFRDTTVSVSDVLFNLFASVMACLFNSNGHLIVQNAAKNFGGKEFVTPEWLTPLFTEMDKNVLSIVLQFVREGYITCFLASCSIIDMNPDEADGFPSDETMRDILQQLNELDRESVVSPINSSRFAGEFTLGDKKLYAIAGEKILYFSLQNTRWSVFQVNHEYARGIWSQEAKDILFLGNEDSERISIQENIYFLNNLIIQSCDSPIGYPAYCSEIFEAYANPLMKDNLILH